MGTQISPMLAVGDGNAAIEFYKAAFGATLLWCLDGGVAGLSIDGANFFLAEESPPHGTRGPASAGFTTVRIELFVDDPSRCTGALWPRGLLSEIPSVNIDT
jgi:PhnB protein